MSAIYTGPQCPSCDAPLEASSVRSGLNTCTYCGTPFEATQFQPRERRHQAVQIVTETPDGAAAACANHSMNAAVTSCSRCGLFICALCDMNVGDGSYCPSCFDRLRDTSALDGGGTRYRDYATMAISAAVIGLICWTLPVGPFAVFWGIRGIRQRRTEGSGIGGPVTAIVLGSLETLALLSFVVLFIIGIVTGNS